LARIGAQDITMMLENPGIIRSRAKIEATIAGARNFLDMQRAEIDFSDWAWHFADGKSHAHHRYERYGSRSPVAKSSSLFLLCALR
jgi:3-methyladenine DNA glycosylase Tag